MTSNELDRFYEYEFAMNPESRCPCVLLLDTSKSMAGAKIKALNSGIQFFYETLRADRMAAKRIETATIGFGPVKIFNTFTTADDLEPSVFVPSGNTPMGKAIQTAISMISIRKSLYKQHGIGYFRPLIFMITDGEPTDEISTASNLVRESEAAKALSFFAIGVDRVNLQVLSTISVRRPLKLRKLEFINLFGWLSTALIRVAAGHVTLPSPTWAIVE
jgi:uncharacterized protein YegL